MYKHDVLKLHLIHKSIKIFEFMSMHILIMGNNIHTCLNKDLLTASPLSNFSISRL